MGWREAVRGAGTARACDLAVSAGREKWCGCRLKCEGVCCVARGYVLLGGHAGAPCTHLCPGLQMRLFDEVIRRVENNREVPGSAEKP